MYQNFNFRLHVHVNIYSDVKLLNFYFHLCWYKSHQLVISSHYFLENKTLDYEKQFRLVSKWTHSDTSDIN